MKPIAGMIGRDESMPNLDPSAEMSSGDRDIARALAIDILERDVVLANIPPRILKLLMRAAIRYIPAGVPESAPHEVAAADDQTRPATVPDHSPAQRAALGSLKPCTCDNCLGSSVRCRGAENLGRGWYCQQTLARGSAGGESVAVPFPPYSGSPEIDFPPVVTGPGLPAPGVICEPIDDESSGVCDASDDSSTTQHRPGKASPTVFIDLNDKTQR